ncbi:MAG TPA: cupin domain-containing protein, partial [Longimicrobiaceae bacterium]|nr:cupin domain-containing protein [Longimicrobiaceae bacterium]
MRTAYLLGTVALLATSAACMDRDAVPLQAQTPHTAAGSTVESRKTTPHEDRFTWGPAPAVFPAGAEMAVLQGDPSMAGEVFTVRLRFPDGYVIPAHWHPTDEHVTVIRGTLLLGMGDRFDADAFLPPLGAGDFITARAHMNHFVMAQGPTEVQ